MNLIQGAYYRMAYYGIRFGELIFGRGWVYYWNFTVFPINLSVTQETNYPTERNSPSSCENGSNVTVFGRIVLLNIFFFWHSNMLMYSNYPFKTKY